MATCAKVATPALPFAFGFPFGLRFCGESPPASESESVFAEALGSAWRKMHLSQYLQSPFLWLEQSGTCQKLQSAPFLQDPFR